MAQIETWLRTDLKHAVRVQPIDGNLFSADNGANRVGVILTNNGQSVNITGGISGYFIRSDEATVIITGAASGNRGWVDLPASAYVKTGPFSLVIKNGNTAIGACTGYVYRSSTDEIIDPGHVIPSIDELLAEISHMRQATADANEAATNANTKATAANTAADNANTKATAANTAANAANTAAGKINNMTVAASGLAAGANPTATISEVSGHKHILFGIPKGDTGNQGPKGDTGPQGPKGDTGSTGPQGVKGDKGDTGAQGPKGDTGSTGPQGAKGDKGDPGKDFHIKRTFASISAMNSYDPTQDQSEYKVLVNDFVMIDTGSVEDADTGKLFCYEPDTQDVWRYIGDLSGKQGIQGPTGNGISSVVLNQDYTLTINYTDGTSTTTTSIRGAQGPKGDTGSTGATGPKGDTGDTGATGATPDISVGTVTTLLPDQPATVELDQSSTPEAPVFNFGIPKGETGSAQNMYGSTIEMSPQDSTKVATAIIGKLDKNQGSGNAGKYMKVGSTGELEPDTLDVSGKADKVANAVNGNFASLDANGNLTDSGHKHTDYILSSEKGANSGVAELDANGKVPASQLPSYVDDVLEYDRKELIARDFPNWVSGKAYAVGDDVMYSEGQLPDITIYPCICIEANSDTTFDFSKWRVATFFPWKGESGKIYVDTSTNITYRWSGSTYVAIGSDLALGETSSTAYRGDRGAAAYAAAVANVDSTPTENSTHLITSGGVKAEFNIMDNRLLTVENVYTDTDVTIAATDWTAGNDNYTYTWQSTLVTSGCGVEVFLRDGADGAGISGFDYSKVAGGVQFITNEQPSGSLPVTIRLINTKSDGLLTLNADEVLSEAITGCDTVEEALTDLDDRVDSLADDKVNKTDIVNNLTTNDSTKVLSAAQGYALNSNITNHATANHYDTITGGEVLSHGDIRIINMLDGNATIPTTGVKLIDKANYQNIRSMCKYYNGSADTMGFLKIETSGNDTYLYVTNLSGSKVSATYVSGSLVYTASSYNG